ncbi:MAG TPA: lipoprotein-releasing ABC transporter permease subunit [Gammaproteobacteria bacterium]|nr:lipoprotein-releasing ABC transporter permease subunit [Gammaproteobacteria bacterium]
MFRPFELFVGLRYLRAKRRNHFISFISVISVLGIIVGVMALITVLSVMNGFDKELRSRILGFASHVTISGFDGQLEDWQEVAAVAQKNEHVVGLAPYVSGQGLLANGGNVSGAIIRGVAPDKEEQVSTVAKKTVEGSFEALKPGSWGIVLGRYLAMKLGVGVGDNVILMVPQGNVTVAGLMPRFRRFHVVGIFEAGEYTYDSSLAEINISDARKLFDMGAAVTGVRLKLDNLFLAPAVSRQLVREYRGQYYVQDWTQQRANFFQAIQTEKRVMFVILSLIIAVAAFNIVSTLVMVVNDKQADIAILRTLGARPGAVMRVFIVQGTLIGIVGIIIGLILGILLAQNINDIMQFLESVFHINLLPADVYYISDLPSDMHWSDVIKIGCSAFVLTLLSTLYPAWRASRVQPAEALRYE